MTERRTYTAEERAEALRLYAEAGAGEAARRTGIPQPTISSWARRAGVQSDAPERTRDAVERAKITWEQRRVGLANRIGELAEHLTDQAFDVEPRDAKALVDALRGATETAQLLAGGATSRSEVDVKDPAQRLALVSDLREQAAKRAAGQEQAS